MGQGEDQVKVAAGKDFSPAVVDPLFLDQGLVDQELQFGADSEGVVQPSLSYSIKS